jgi:hypothetical protein
VSAAPAPVPNPAWNSHVALAYHLSPEPTGTCAPFSQARMDQLPQQLGMGGVQTVRVAWNGVNP